MIFKSKKEKRIREWVKDFENRLRSKVEGYSVDNIDILVRNLYIETARLFQSPSKLEKALEESLKLQCHYASLLNQYDGGQRMIFKDSEEWIARLDYVKKCEENLPCVDK